MGLFGAILGLAVDTAALPFRVVQDVVTLPESALDPSRGPLDNTIRGLSDITKDLL